MHRGISHTPAGAGQRALTLLHLSAPTAAGLHYVRPHGSSTLHSPPAPLRTHSLPLPIGLPFLCTLPNAGAQHHCWADHKNTSICCSQQLQPLSVPQQLDELWNLNVIKQERQKARGKVFPISQQSSCRIGWRKRMQLSSAAVKCFKEHSKGLWQQCIL